MPDRRGESQMLQFDVLINAQFPYSAIRIALKSFDARLKWPHIEPGGLLCLPRTPPPDAGVEDAVIRALTGSLTLVEQCADPEFIIGEFRREFISYWSRGIQDSAKEVRSLLDLTNRDTRQIVVWYGQTFTLAGDTPHQIRSWLENRGSAKDTDSVPGVFGFLKVAPTMPYPNGTRDLYALYTLARPHKLLRLVENGHRNILSIARRILTLHLNTNARSRPAAFASSRTRRADLRRLVQAEGKTSGWHD
jgi:hypothetical protein